MPIILIDLQIIGVRNQLRIFMIGYLYCVSIRKLAGKTIFISGARRGIGKAIALKAAKDGANIVIAAKTAQPHPKLPGTIYTAAKEGDYLQLSKCFAVGGCD